ncbi:carboxypeptidase M32 [Telmatospirillum siberiense]|uniref:Metal-dependent carboxypeptidase n=1 Tax=Telmatospirillum siberiense TaxID=382514 RepID=A0A2N3PUB7_9PROT|nr:carboxypeptidase M32 [Telmatospirillum siberiense]PKU23986.1 carboxypeptidase M32 [Telmatospirillum siberiense]
MALCPAYARLERIFHRLTLLEQAQGLLHWDMAAMMPPGGAESRGEQLATLKALSHELLTAAEVKPLLDAAVEEDLDDWQRANLSEMRRDWVHAAAVPSRLVEDLSRAGSACETVWRKARAAADFSRVAPSLAEVLRLTREMAEIKSQALGVSRYDALLDQYEPGGRSAVIDVVFDDLAAFLPGFLQQVLSRQAPPPQGPRGPFPVERQKALGLRMMEVLGFDFEHGRLDVSQHPFCGGTPDDVRITTRYDENAFIKSMMGVIHETGHALYERGLPAAWRTQPVGRARGMSLHESQSLLMEMQACRSREFLSFAAPVMAEAFGAVGQSGWDAGTLFALNVRVAPAFIRVDADEVTYPAHVILRYRLEKALIAGEIDVADIPAAWNDGMDALLGVRPPDDAQGCLQDIHWYDGAFGYFPTYTLGAMIAAQLFEAAGRALPDLPASIGRGDFRPLLGWLREAVHGQASRYGTDELLTRATGRPLDPSVFKTHLRRRYLDG